MKSMPRAILFAAAMLAGTTTTGYAADAVTFYEHVAPILQANCVSCHRPAGQNIGSLVAPSLVMPRVGPAQCRASIANTGSQSERFRFTVRLTIRR